MFFSSFSSFLCFPSVLPILLVLPVLSLSSMLFPILHDFLFLILLVFGFSFVFLPFPRYCSCYQYFHSFILLHCLCEFYKVTFYSFFPHLAYLFPFLLYLLFLRVLLSFLFYSTFFLFYLDIAYPFPPTFFSRFSFGLGLSGWAKWVLYQWVGGREEKRDDGEVDEGRGQRRGEVVRWMRRGRW